MVGDDAIKMRLQAAMQTIEENKKCVDCSERKPTWASIIVPPKNAPEDSPTIAALCCYQCSTPHRSLGTHICRVKSCNLDEWNEKEIKALELGGNDRVNSIFEATCTFECLKPTPHSDAQLRMKFVREKYQSHNFYDSAAYKVTMETRRDSLLSDGYDQQQHLLSPITPKFSKPPVFKFDDMFSPLTDTDEDDEIFDDEDDDMFADSKTTTDDLFGHCTKSPKKKTQAPNFLSSTMIIEGEEEEKELFGEDDTFAQFAMDRSTLNFGRAPPRAPQIVEDKDGLDEDTLFDDRTVESSEPPQVPTLGDTSVLEAEKKRAVAEEDYLRAAELKKQIDLEVEKKQAVAEEDYLRAAELKKQIDLLTGAAACCQGQTKHRRQRPQYNSSRSKWRNPTELRSTITNEAVGQRQSLGSFLLTAGQGSEELGTSKGSPQGLRRHSLHSNIDAEKEEDGETAPLKTSGRPSSRNFLEQTVLSAPQENEVDEFGFVVKGNDMMDNSLRSSDGFVRDGGFDTPGSVKSRLTVQTAPVDLQMDGFGFATSPQSLKSDVVLDGAAPSRRRSSSRSRRSSHHSRRSSHSSRRGERRPSMASEGGDLLDEEIIHHGDPLPKTRRSSRRSSSHTTQEAGSTPSSRSQRRLSIASDGGDIDKEIHHLAPSTRRLSGRSSTHAHEAPVTPSSRCSERKLRSIASPTTVADLSPLLHRRERTKQLKSTEGNTGLTRSSPRSERSSYTRSSKKHQQQQQQQHQQQQQQQQQLESPIASVKRQHRLNPGKWKSPLEAC